MTTTVYGQQVVRISQSALNCLHPIQNTCSKSNKSTTITVLRDSDIVIKYVPTVGDFKHSINEYYSEILCGGRSTISILNECEDSLRRKPFSLVLSILGELFTRVKYHDVKTRKHSEFQPLYPVFLLLLLTLKASLAKPGKHPTSRIFAMKADMAVPRY